MIDTFLKKHRELNVDAVICGDDRISYKDLNVRVNLLRDHITHEVSDVVIIFISNSIHYLVAYFSILFAGKVVYPISSLSKPDELMSAITSTNCRCILTIDEHVEDIKALCSGKDIIILSVSDINVNSAYCAEAAPADVKRKSDDTCLLLNTSGSTDKHKIIMLTEENIVYNCKDWIDIALDPSEHATVLVTMPASTSFGKIVITTCIMLGWTIVFLPSAFNISTVLQVMEKEGISHLIAIGTMLNILALNIPKLRKSNYRADSLKFIGVGGNGAAEETLKALMGYFTEVGVSSGYGITEATCMVSTIPPSVSLKNKELFFEKINSAGKPYNHSEVRIFLKGNYISTPGVSGEIVIRGPTIMKGYYNNIKATNAVIKDGYLHTGDIGFIDNDGYLYILGRVKNIIKTRGYTVFPEEIEAVIMNSGLVSEVYVYGVSDKIADEIIIADVKPINSSIRMLDLEKYCRKRLTDYKMPYKIRAVASIVKTSNGKIQRTTQGANERE